MQFEETPEAKRLQGHLNPTSLPLPRRHDFRFHFLIFVHALGWLVTVCVSGDTSAILLQCPQGRRMESSRKIAPSATAELGGLARTTFSPLFTPVLNDSRKGFSTIVLETDVFQYTASKETFGGILVILFPV